MGQGDAALALNTAFMHGGVIIDVAAGHVQLAFAEAAATQQLIRDGRLRALAVSSAARFTTLPQVPTVAGALNRPGYEAVSWHALAAPSATPRALMLRLNADPKASLIEDLPCEERDTDHIVTHERG